ncbi:MAG: hypothetical protein U0871_16365 [Gemmataceae bacterium]
MPLPELPPRAEVLDALKYAVAPAAGAAAVVFGGAALVGGLARLRWRQAMPAVAAVAVLAGLVAGNLGRGALPWVPDAKWWQWGWWAILLGAAAEFAARCVGPAVAHLIRAAAVGIVAAAVIPTDWQTELVWKPSEDAVGFRWAVPLFVAATAGMWGIVVEVGRRSPGSATLATVIVACGTTAVLLHQSWLSGADAATFLLASVTAVTVLGLLTRQDGSGAAGAAVLPVAVLLVIGRGLISDPTAPNAVPKGCSLLVGLAPLGLGLFLLPGLNRLPTRRFGAVLPVAAVLLAVAAAVGWAMSVAPLKFGEESW